MARQPYWIGKRPSDAKRWQGAEAGEVLDVESYGDSLFRMYRRYAKQWNDIELDHSRDLSEHTHLVCSARVVGSTGKFTLHNDISRDDGWILEVKFRRGLSQFYPGWSTGLNALRSKDDISQARLHWRGNGRNAFDAWLTVEREENEAHGEWTEYRA